MKILFVILLTLSAFYTEAQNKPKIVEISGVGEVYWDPMKQNKEEAQNQAEELAKVNALETAFGVVIVQGNTTVIKSLTEGEKTTTQTKFDMIGNTFVKGEVIEVVGKKFTEVKGTKKEGKNTIETTVIKCDITLKAREITEAKLDIKSFSLACNTSLKCNATDFKNGDDFYLYFKSPVSGFVTVFYDDNTNAARILPYQKVPVEFENGMPIDADKEYVFFSNNKKHNYYKGKALLIDELQLSTEQDKEMSRIYVVFSKTPLNKPALNPGKKEILTEEEIKRNFEVPAEMPSYDFQNWLIKNRTLSAEIEVISFFISISKK